ncbi:MAG: methionine--tRNA ligase, partial [Lachnospiraceae bacterium]|nr:methionine--tRNA ligase [Lachnospiraceae bacterium]
MSKKPYYITTAIAYTSGKPHIGNTYEAILADSIARYKRFQGYDVFLQTGTDEHGQKIEEKAAAAGVTPKEFVDNVSAEIKRIWDLVDTSYDKFIRTTDADHEKQVKKIFKKMVDKGDIYKGAYEGMYCTPCESFWTDSQLVDGKCPDCGRAVQPAKEEAYFFKMSKYADRLIEHINTHPEFIQPVSRKNEMMNNFLLPGLQDLCVSRTSFKWGIPVEEDPKHVVYVWLDALTNYITGIGYDADGNHTEQFNKFWPADLHLIGKDIIRFHTIYWPIFLMSLDIPLPKQIFGHPWLLQGGDKMSKSKGNVIYADDMAELFGVDAVRYFVLHEMPFDNDGTITWELLVERLNADLANTLGNLVNRTISMSNKYFGGVVRNGGVAEPVDEELKALALETPGIVEEKMEKLRVADAISAVFNLFKRCNKYIDETAPWALAKDPANADRLTTVLYNLVESICIGASLLKSFLPRTADKIFAQLNATERGVE